MDTQLFYATLAVGCSLLACLLMTIEIFIERKSNKALRKQNTALMNENQALITKGIELTNQILNAK